uniref:Imidazole glycerol phosphate synthase subunit HisH n=1 Tax=Candidatus Blochmannia ocreatus (nom. nud.) TaxID=251538 RepID=D2XN26_9ENTR|nr:imidazole glycerol phosphate synthase HisH subunit [Candidatus Blochmannia ocreatus]
MNIIIINTKCANLFSVHNVLYKLGYNAVISDEADIISKADKLLLPGVGTVTAAMQQLKKKNLVKLIQQSTQPILGICLGMQLLGINSEENSHINTLKIIDIPIKQIKFGNLPLPHMGWNTISIPKKKHPLFYDIKKNDYFYFAHSYYIDICHVTISQTWYGHYFSAVIEYKNFFGVQFHPEKSSTPGEKLIKNFMEM